MNKELQNVISFAEFELDSAQRVLRRNGETVPLNAKTFDLLTFLIVNNGRVLGKGEILEAVWDGQLVEEANLSVQISALRKALGEKKDAPRFLVTVPGKGYKFIAEIEESDDFAEIMIESHKISRLVVEETDEIAAATSIQDNLPAVRDATALPWSWKHAAVLLVAVVLLVGVVGFSRFLQPVKIDSKPFERVKLTRLTNSGKISAAALSPDGKFLAYVAGGAEGNSLWVRQVGAANDMQIVPPTKATFYGLTFTPDGAEIYYNLYAGDKTDLELFSIPTLGGVVRKIPDVIAPAVTFSPDGKRFAYVQPDSKSGINFLVVADADGKNQQILAQKPQPNTFSWGSDYTVWSPDGETIACLLIYQEAEGNYNRILGISVRDGSERLLSPQKWRDVNSIKWLSDGAGLIVSASTPESRKNQIWLASTADGAVRAITDDFNSYSALGVGTAGNSFIALENSEKHRLLTGEIGGELREMVSEMNALHPIVWTSDGKIIFRSLADGAPNLWQIDADGANRRQLTSDAQVDGRGMCASADGRYVFFTSERAGKPNIWRVDTNGQNLTRLTDGEADAYPACAPDGKSILFQRGIYSKPRLWKISIDGGEPRQLADYNAKWASFSADGNRISYFFMKDSQWRFGFLTPDGNPAAEDIAVPVNLRESRTQWSADNRTLYYIDTPGSTGNIHALSTDTLQSKPLTNLKNYLIADFSISPDEKYLAVAQTENLSDIVLVTDVK